MPSCRAYTEEIEKEKNDNRTTWKEEKWKKTKEFLGSVDCKEARTIWEKGMVVLQVEDSGRQGMLWGQVKYPAKRIRSRKSSAWMKLFLTFFRFASYLHYILLLNKYHLFSGLTYEILAAVLAWYCLGCAITEMENWINSKSIHQQNLTSLVASIATAPWLASLCQNTLNKDCIRWMSVHAVGNQVERVLAFKRTWLFASLVTCTHKVPGRTAHRLTVWVLGIRSFLHFLHSIFQNIE